MVDVQFRQAQHEDMTITYIEPSSRRTTHELKGIFGVEHVEPIQDCSGEVPVWPPHLPDRDPGLRDRHQTPLSSRHEAQAHRAPASGIVLTDYLANMLGIKVGDQLTVEVLEGAVSCARSRLHPW